MLYGVATEVAGPIEMYDTVHAAVTRAVGTAVDGLVLHVARRPTQVSN